MYDNGAVDWQISQRLLISPIGCFILFLSSSQRSNFWLRCALSHKFHSIVRRGIPRRTVTLCAHGATVSSSFIPSTVWCSLFWREIFSTWQMENVENLPSPSEEDLRVTVRTWHRLHPQMTSRQLGKLFNRNQKWVLYWWERDDPKSRPRGKSSPIRKDLRDPYWFQWLKSTWDTMDDRMSAVIEAHGQHTKY